VSLERVVEVIERSGELPTIGAVAAEVMRLAGDPSADFGKVAAAVENDPSLAAKVLRLANSPFYGLRGEVASVERAVALLGMAQVRNIALSLSLIRDFSGAYGGETFRWDRFWEHSAGVALIAETMTRLLRVPVSGTEYAAGLLHDVGKILLGHHFPEEFGRCLDLAARRQVSLWEVEPEVFGTHHAQLGGWIAERWGFPAPLRSAIRYHHEPGEAGDEQGVAAVVHLADLFAKVKQIGFGGDRVAVCFADDPAWAVLVERQPHLGDLDLARFTLQLDQEVEMARALAKLGREP